MQKNDVILVPIGNEKYERERAIEMLGKGYVIASSYYDTNELSAYLVMVKVGGDEE